jgi:hypothetical protein
MLNVDTSGQEYQEIPYPNGDHLRVTLVPHGYLGGRSLRVQAHDVSGKLFPGPEIPINYLAEVIAAMVRLVVR